jgi:hypothetical protein
METLADRPVYRLLILPNGFREVSKGFLQQRLSF